MIKSGEHIEVRVGGIFYIALPHFDFGLHIKACDARTGMELWEHTLPFEFIDAMARAKLEPQLPPAVIQEAALEYVMNSVIGRDETHWQYSNIDDAIKALRALLPSPPSPNEEPKA